MSEGTNARDIPRDRLAITIGVASNSVSDAHYSGVKSEISALFSSLHVAYPNTPLVLLSTLSSEFDMAAVDAARKHGAFTIACTPETIDVSDDAVAKQSPRDSVERWRSACARVQSFASTPNYADRLRDAKTFIATYSDILLAFRKNVNSPIVEAASADMTDESFALQSLGIHQPTPLFSIILDAGDEHETPVMQTSRSFSERFTGDSAFAADFAAALKHIDTFNYEVSRFKPGHPITSVFALRALTDAIANSLQKTTYRYLYVLYVCAIAATAAQYVFSPAFKFPMIALAFVAYLIAKRNDYENRYQDYRAFSEGLRVQEVWIHGGLGAELPDEAYLRMQHRDLLWIRMALRYVHLLFDARAAKGSVTDSAVKSWINDQWKYFRNKPRIEEHDLNRIKLYTRFFFYLAASVSTILFAYLYLPVVPAEMASISANAAISGLVPDVVANQLSTFSHLAVGVQSWLNGLPIMESALMIKLHAWDIDKHHQLLVKLSTAFLTIYAAVALLLGNYGNKRGFALNVKRYDRMFVVFDRAKRRLEAIDYADDSSSRHIVKELGREALIENADWLLVRRERPLTFVNP